MVHSVGSLLNLVPNGLLSTTHEGTLECVVPIDLTECACWFVHNGELRLGAFGRGGFWSGQFAAALLGGFGC